MKQCNVKKCIHSEITDKISKKNRKNLLYHCEEFDQNFDPDVIRACNLYKESKDVVNSE